MDQKNITEKIKAKFEESVFEITEFRGDVSITVDPNKIVEIAGFLKNDEDLQFVMCKDVTAIDWATRKNRFTVVYHVYSFKNNFNLRIKANISEEPPAIDSVTPVWRSANWYERETYDMYGINFRNHPDLRRMYMPEGFEYHPLRKEFPVLGIPGSLPLPEKPE
ncbi:NADH dehydrogenase subunit C [Melioribacter roseus P3M-2]|jgi:NADH-quinone oxidoreductase subunit C|uniref:NADH-quinone oxidoreductase subunit C n=1 Tax=Melioribacter roseus (strain DSM 23840 / JCM 17771 / VKM B-2668 / P3M-2) TaxID=1191523 RepID=I6YSA6_MELRP|nr:NADH-quinone oxidoreductase subunit C [Melioribacter roseus]AFN73402.1 NADH dehydrogenase subunit C [Melioribacter roseus P3M-2]